MARTISAAEFHADPTLADWRVMLRRAEAVFRAPTFAGAAVFIERVAVAADLADHHPDIDLRYPGRVHVTLTTHASAGLTDLDMALARQISELAATTGLVSEPGTFIAFELGIDALDIAAVRPFWKAVLGYVDEKPSTPGAALNGLVDPLRIGPPVWFQQMDAARAQRNRLHVDVTVAHDVAEARVGAALAAGGTLLTDEHARAFWVLADPEGNEACVCTWQDRD
jgi:4a-hydroxytetrahydrobiopterin dehydratase